MIASRSSQLQYLGVQNVEQFLEDYAFQVSARAALNGRSRVRAGAILSGDALPMSAISLVGRRHWPAVDGREPTPRDRPPAA